MAFTLSGISGITGLNLTTTQPAPPVYMWTWGYNSQGQLGLGNTTYFSSPVQIGALTTWSKVSAGDNGSMAIKTDGTMWSWGYNHEGQLGLGNTTARSSPVQIGALTTWSSISAGGYFHSAAIKTDGTIWTWGSNYLAQLGLGDTTARSSPVQIGALTNWSKLSVGKAGTTAIKTDGTMWSWGWNGYGVLGINAGAVSYSSPKQIGALTTWSSVSMKDYVCAAIKTDGTLWIWGNGGYGRLGLGDININRSSPVQVGALTTWSSVSAGKKQCAAIKTDGTLWTWGKNTNGNLGVGNTIDRSSPVQVGALTNWLSVSAGGYGCAAIKTDGTMWSWGYGVFGQLGDNSTTSKSSPVQVGALTTWSTIDAGSYHSLAIG
jgi:alpha-tubulin suppressor-like RCC1 family protein